MTEEAFERKLLWEAHEMRPPPSYLFSMGL